VHRALLFVILALMGSATLLAEAPPDTRQVREFASKFGPVFVVDEGDVRVLRFGDPDASDQTVIHLADPDRVPLEYVRTAALGFSFPEKPRRALMIGLGGGAFVRVTRRWFPEVKLTAVEIDPVVVELAQQYFGVIADERSRLVVDDGGRYLKRNTGPWDLVFLDAYDGDEVPSHLATRAFFDLVRARLAPGGVAVMNLAVDDDKLQQKIRERFAGAFPGCTAVTEPEWGNVLLFGTATRKGHGLAPLTARARALSKARGLPFQLGDVAAEGASCRVTGQPKPGAAKTGAAKPGTAAQKKGSGLPPVAR